MVVLMARRRVGSDYWCKGGREHGTDSNSSGSVDANGLNESNRSSSSSSNTNNSNGGDGPASSNESEYCRNKQR